MVKLVYCVPALWYYSLQQSKLDKLSITIEKAQDLTTDCGTTGDLYLNNKPYYLVTSTGQPA